MQNPKKKVYLSEANLQTIANGGSLTSGSDTFVGDEDTIYMTPEVIDSTPTQNSENPVASGGVYTALAGKQATLVSGTNIKTVNSESIVGSGNLEIPLPTVIWW